MLKYTLNGKWFKREKELTSHGEYNFTQSPRLNS